MAYDVAISFASEDQWIAKDLFTLLSSQGLSVYFSEKQPDATAGFFRKELFSIYQHSTLNILLWSSSYATKNANSPIHMEKNVLFDRHIGGNEHGSLLVVNVDNSKDPKEFAFCPAHPLRKHSIVGVKEFAIDRLIKCWKCGDVFSDTFDHPPTKNRRKQMDPFAFTIKDDFDNKTRWKTLGDIEVVPVNYSEIPKKLKVFLIPSGNRSVPIFLSHSTLLKTRDTLLETKQKTGLEFVRQYMGKQLIGAIFYIDKDIAFPHAYCHEYDKFLCDNWRNYYSY